MRKSGISKSATHKTDPGHIHSYQGGIGKIYIDCVFFGYGSIDKSFSGLNRVWMMGIAKLAACESRGRAVGYKAGVLPEHDATLHYMNTDNKVRTFPVQP